VYYWVYDIVLGREQEQGAGSREQGTGSREQGGEHVVSTIPVSDEWEDLMVDATNDDGWCNTMMRM
jgi:hypothetical protein